MTTAKTFEKLEEALSKIFLPAVNGSKVIRTADDFMQMGFDKKLVWAWFKSRETRNYICLHIATGRIYIPNEDKPFRRGQF